MALVARQGADRVTMEEIAAEAGVGRATVYFHYPNKGAILIDNFRDQLGRQLRLHEHLLGTGPLGFARIRDWIDGFIAVLIDHRNELSLFQVSVTRDSELKAMVVEHRERLLGLLVSRSEGLAAALGGPDERRLRTEALLMLLEVDQFSSSIASQYPGLDRQIGTDLVARRLWDFIAGLEGQ